MKGLAPNFTDFVAAGSVLLCKKMDVKYLQSVW